MQRTINLHGQCLKQIMKLIPALLFLLLFSSCTKNNSTQVDNSFTGKWNEYENYISPGTLWQWEKANNITIEINSDLTYTSNNENYFWGKSGRIENLTDSTFLLISPVFNSSLTCNYKIKNGVLEVWYPCIEGCGSRFKKQNSSGNN
jgi:hypothetical protein